jgi:hypothetical protein
MLARAGSRIADKKVNAVIPFLEKSHDVRNGGEIRPSGTHVAIGPPRSARWQPVAGAQSRSGQRPETSPKGIPRA